MSWCVKLISWCAVLLGIATGASPAAPLPAEGYTIAIVQKPGAIFAGLARDQDFLLVTNLADGRLYRRGRDGVFVAFGPALPHGIDVIGDPTGPYKVIPLGAFFLVVQGWTPNGQKEGAYDHALLEIDQKGDVRVLSSDFWNPFDVVTDGDIYFVVDAARNSIERLYAGNGERTTLFTFARLSEQSGALQQLSPTEFTKGKPYEFDAVPTGIALRDQRLYVSLFGGFPFVPGAGRVVSLSAAEPSAEARMEAADLNAPVDVAFFEDGDMLVLEHGTFDASGGWTAGSGRLLRIDPVSGERDVLLDGLTRPASALIFDEGRIVVSELGGTLIFLNRK